MSQRNLVKLKQNCFIQKSLASNSCKRQKKVTAAVKDVRERGLKWRYKHCEIMEFLLKHSARLCILL